MPIYRATVKITLRKSILDPQGNATQHALASLGFDAIQHVRIGKNIELKIEAPTSSDAREIAESAAAKLLANPVMDDFEVTVVADAATVSAS